jgi:hypothetical protein
LTPRFISSQALRSQHKYDILRNFKRYSWKNVF